MQIFFYPSRSKSYNNYKESLYYFDKVKLFLSKTGCFELDFEEFVYESIKNCLSFVLNHKAYKKSESIKIYIELNNLSDSDKNYVSEIKMLLNNYSFNHFVTTSFDNISFLNSYRVS